MEQKPKWSMMTRVLGECAMSASMAGICAERPRKHMKPTGAPSSPARLYMARPSCRTRRRRPETAAQPRTVPDGA